MARGYVLDGGVQPESERDTERLTGSFARPVTVPGQGPGPAAVRTAVLEAVAGWVPGEPVGNDALPAAWGVDDAWVRARTGIVSRHRAGVGLATGDVAFEAARRLVGDGGSTAAGPVDALVLATTTPDHPCPGTAPPSLPGSVWERSPHSTSAPRAAASSTGSPSAGDSWPPASTTGCCWWAQMCTRPGWTRPTGRRAWCSATGPGRHSWGPGGRGPR